MRPVFRNLGARERRNLALAALLNFYLITAAYNLLVLGPFISGLGLDFLTFWSAGYLGGSAGYSKIYNVELLMKVRTSFISTMERFSPHPFLYLPVFALPFRIFALLPPLLSFSLWTFLNLLALVFYVKFFVKRMALSGDGKWPFIMLLFSYPVFQNFYFGQVGVWLLICIGEFIRALLGGKPWRAGVWLAGLLLKPQILVLLILPMLLYRDFRVIGGFAFGALFLLFLSALVGGSEGLSGMVSLWLNAGKGAFEAGQGNMMNWRMLGLHLSALTSPFLGWTVAGLGMALTGALAFYLWVKLYRKAFIIALLGVLAATMAIAWHSHFHTCMLLIPPLICLGKVIPNSLLDIWVFGPPITTFLIYFAGALARITGLSLPAGYGGPILGSCFLALNLILLFWAIKQGTRAIDP